tara:strand:- start:3139 stop:3441 length:303 start_codon:yes stop_codon:yes gene_type:complete
MGKEKPFYIQIIKLIANKYIITIFLFSIWMLFIDDYNLINKKATIEKINYLQERKKFLSNEIKKDSTKKVLLENNVNEQERIAREKYLMKKDNEDLFIIR